MSKLNIHQYNYSVSSPRGQDSWLPRMQRARRSASSQTVEITSGSLRQCGYHTGVSGHARVALVTRFSSTSGSAKEAPANARASKIDFNMLSALQCVQCSVCRDVDGMVRTDNKDYDLEGRSEANGRIYLPYSSETCEPCAT